MNAVDELFGTVPAFLPSFLDGETLFSWGARYHRLSGNVLARQSSVQLFGNARAGLKHDFPFHLDQFTSITRQLMGEPKTLAMERTLLGFYAPFLTDDECNRAVSEMRSSSVAALKTLLGLMPSRVGAGHPLKACLSCVGEDIRQYGSARWILEHQWPTIWICRRHRRRLVQLARSAQPKELRRWLSPEDIHEVDWLATDVSGEESDDKLLKIAEVSAGIAKDSARKLESRLLRYAYLLGAKRQGWLFPDGSMRLKEFGNAFRRYLAPLQNIPGISGSVTVDGEHGGVLGLLMRQYPGRRHPLKHAILIAFLFPSFADFDRVYGKARRFADHTGTEHLHRLLVGDEHVELRRLVEDEHRSVSQAAQVLGMSVGVAVRWSNRDGVRYQKRPRVLTEALKARLTLMIQSGSEYAEISKKTGIKKSLIRSYLAKNVSLRNLWRERRLEQLRETRRRQLIYILTVHRGASIKAIRRIPGNGFSWLARNDREWLMTNLPLVRKVASS